MILRWLERAAQAGGGRLAVVQRDGYLSLRGLIHRAARRAEELRAMGVREGHAVGVLLGNVVDAVVVVVAAERLGAAALPLPPLSTARELGLLQRVVPVRAVVARPGAKVLDAAGRARAGEATGPAPTRRTRLSGSLLTAAVFPTDDVAPLPRGTLAVHAIPTVSADGTAGVDFVPRRGEEIRAEAERLAQIFRFGTGVQERLVAALPLEQPFLFETVLAGVCGYGVPLHMEDDISPRAVLEALREGGPALALVTRAQLSALAAQPAPKPLPEGTRLVCVDGPVTRAVAQRVRAQLGLRPEGSLHQPETGLMALDEGGRSPETTGLPAAGIDLRILGARGTPIGPGRAGALEARGASVSTARAGALSPAPAEPPWIATGWRARWDRAGRLRPESRTDDRVLAAGLPVSLREIETVLCAHRAVRQARVWRLETDPAVDPGTRGGIAAEVVLARAIPPEALETHCEGLLAPHKVPTHIRAVQAIGAR